MEARPKPCQDVFRGKNISVPQLTNEIINAAIFGFEEQKRQLDAQIAELRAMLSPGSNGSAGSTSPAEPAVREKQGMSAAGRKAIAEAQRKRWAAVKGQSIEPVAAKRPKRKLSAAGKTAIVAALKKRWAAKRAEAKK
jgi:hypothetical protein